MPKDINDIEFIHWLEKRLSLPLPGKDAQMRMAPRIRPPKLSSIFNSKHKESSVLILFFPDKEKWHLPFIHRNDYKGSHSAQVSFPGGKKETHDENDVATALREAKEEIGINPDDVKILGKLTDLYIPPSNFMVHPVVGFVNYVPDFIPDPKEVQKIMTAPLHQFLVPESVLEKPIKTFMGINIRAPYFDMQGHELWGATSMMLSELIEIAKEYGD